MSSENIPDQTVQEKHSIMYVMLPGINHTFLGCIT